MVYRTYEPVTKANAVRLALEGNSFPMIRRLLGAQTSRQSFNRWLQLYEETRCVIKDPETNEARGRPARLSREDCRFMVDLVQREPGLFLDEIREQLYDSTGVLLSQPGIHRNLVERLSITLKKPETKHINKSLVAKYAWIERMEFYPAEFLVFTDESGFVDKDLLRAFGRSLRGTPAERFLVNSNAARLNLLPAISITGMVSLTTTFENFNARKFEHFLEYDLLPRMNRYPDINSVLVCDNATWHRGQRVPELCEAAGVQLMYLPPYCPELNPIELAFAAVKQQIRYSRILERTNNPEWEIRRVTGEIMTAEYCYKLYKHCGYCVSRN
ncbi:hypothetical protein MJO28_005438 [Puccinia striiformis f. sp. tritici]|uniref:Uncharacterized protein n=1 Tax=Puccinia striiformis f. sp. tritici TaxID=168172 RepID=A0ACC0EK96_9BASI|nr:uncharacterized protein Pst134EA_033558 [Puccinia striiformis f. sp. tritici]KAH9440786.1 hypothetical protein Pst134EA_033558 [Puccinia striiformis f. sp. tritici]KAI7955038.1 hypothetical protein MJO28_005438 [Puccinia striiformis f. sp. tritici]